MPDNQHSFVIPDDQSIPALVSLLQETFPVQVQAEAVYKRVFYDTFDWRLYKSGCALEVHDDGQSHRIYWRADKDGKLKIQLGLKKMPRFAADLPVYEFRQQLQSVIAVRELLPQIKMRIKRQSLAVLDKDKKIVVRLNLDVYWYSTSRLRAAKVLTRRLTIKAVKGYSDDFRLVEEFFLAMHWQPAMDNVMKLALIASGVNTGEYTTRLNLRLVPDMSDEQAFKIILLRLLEIMQQNTSGSIKGRDTQFMHDYRVAIKKIRVALKQINNAHPQAVNTEYKHFFSKLGNLTNPVRDLDVFLLQLENYQPDFKKSGWQQLKPMHEYLLSTRKEAQKKFVEELKSSQYRELIEQWHDYLEHSETPGSSSDSSGKEVYKLADKLLWGINQQTLAQGNAITENSDTEALHELRKTFKKLRYLIEFFNSLYPAGNLRVLIQLLIDVQDSLGEFNDRYIQIGMVKAFIEQCPDGDAIKASEQIITILEQQQQAAGKKFRDSFMAYSSSANQNKFKEMFVDYYKRKK